MLDNSLLILVPSLIAINLAFIHGLFGYDVLKKGIIFVDLALAQCAVLGAIIGHISGLDHPVLIFLCSIVGTTLGAAILTKLESNPTTRLEASIGILYVLTTALSIGVLSKTTMESHLLKEMVSGHLLYTTWSEWMATLLLYSTIAILYTVIQKRQTNTPLSRFAFYSLFGLVVSSSVNIAGILLVFSYLIIPMFIASRNSTTKKKSLALGWTIGVAASILGCIAAVIMDIPLSIGIIMTLGFFLMIILKGATTRN